MTAPPIPAHMLAPARTVAIIGTAGRDGRAELTADLWQKMIADAQARVQPHDTLVSGGAAWADHLAVHLFLTGRVAALTLHLPAPFDGRRFLGPSASAGSAANFYHEKFGRVIGVDTHAQIADAMRKGAQVTVQDAAPGYGAMFARNALVARDATAVIAYTFGQGVTPADGGTKNTWDQVRGDRKHVSLLSDAPLTLPAIVSPAPVAIPPLPPPVPAVAAKRDSMADSECVPNYWLWMQDSGETFELYNDRRYINSIEVTRERWIAALHVALSTYTVVTFNGNHYDIPMVLVALSGADNATLKRANDTLIPGGGMKGPQGWQFIRDWSLGDADWIDHIDLFDVAPGAGSLKAYGGKMHSRKLQDLPFDPFAMMTDEERPVTISYCGNDLRTTRDLFESMSAQLALRRDMSAEYGIDLRSKSDAQIAEAVMKKLLPFKVQRPSVPCGTQFHYRPPAWIAFTSPHLQQLLAEIVRHPFHINDKGSPVPDQHQHFIDWGDQQLRLDSHRNWVKRPKDWKHNLVRVGHAAYAVGSGGLHSTESATVHVADDQWMISDHDVASYYPSLILVTGIAPQQIGTAFAQIYRDWYTRRLTAKRAGQKKVANSLKTLLNGTFGKLGSMWSIFYAPAEMIQVTLTGQLALLMLIERLEMCGVQVISANTDGIVLKTRRGSEWLRSQCIAWWESVTGLETEANEYRLLASRDVNSYTAITPDGKAKTKGAFAPPEPGPSGWPNPTGQIAVDAAVAYLQSGADIDQTVRACTDVRQFVHVRQVQGGGSYSPQQALDTKATQRRMRELVGDLPKDDLAPAYDALRTARLAEVEYLGRIVRWYYATGTDGCILTNRGSLVSRAQGCRPMMELTDTLPDDLDYQWYVDEAHSMLATMGVDTHRN